LHVADLTLEPTTRLDLGETSRRSVYARVAARAARQTTSSLSEGRGQGSARRALARRGASTSPTRAMAHVAPPISVVEEASRASKFAEVVVGKQVSSFANRALVSNRTARTLCRAIGADRVSVQRAPRRDVLLVGANGARGAFCVDLASTRRASKFTVTTRCTSSERCVGICPAGLAGVFEIDSWGAARGTYRVRRGGASPKLKLAVSADLAGGALDVRRGSPCGAHELASVACGCMWKADSIIARATHGHHVLVHRTLGAR
jgi:hypothetical protein